MIVALFEPEIPPNTGNIIRLCANSQTPLHLIKPLGFELSDKQLRRAGLDYHHQTVLQVFENYQDWLKKAKPKRIIACSTKGATRHTDIHYQPGDALLFGPETRGLPQEIRESVPPEQVARIPMANEQRSINLANAVAIILYEALRQLNFPNLH